MEIKILVFEDDPFSSEEIRAHLMTAGYQSVLMASNLSDAMNIIQNDFPDLAILDIQNPDDRLAGIKLAQEIKKVKQIPLIYVTGYYSDEEMKNNAFSTDPVAFLPKPFNEETLLNQIDLAVHKLKLAVDAVDVMNSDTLSTIFNDSIFVKTKRVFQRLLKRDIRYAKADHGYIEIYYSEKSIKYTHSSTLASFVASVNDDSFVKVSRSHAVNITHITGFSEDYLLIGNEYIKIAPKLYTALMNACAILRTKK